MASAFLVLIFRVIIELQILFSMMLWNALVQENNLCLRNNSKTTSSVILLHQYLLFHCAPNIWILRPWMCYHLVNLRLKITRMQCVVVQCKRAYRVIYSLVPHICVNESCLNFASDNGLSPIRHKAIIWTNARLLSNGPSGTILSEISIKIQNFLFTKMHLKISSAKSQPLVQGDELRSVQ